jgi:hypothetical protein
VSQFMQTQGKVTFECNEVHIEIHQTYHVMWNLLWILELTINTWVHMG